MNKVILLSLLTICSFIITSCGNPAPSPTHDFPVKEYSFNFESGEQGWMSSFLGYSESNKNAFAFQSGVASIPDLGTQGLTLAANNPNGELVLFVQKQLSGLAPEHGYNLLYRIGLASNLSSSTKCEGFAGKRTEVKISASIQEPKQVLENNLDILNLNSNDYQRVGVVGHKDRPCEDTAYAINPINNIKAPFNAPVELTSDANGQLWAVIVLDSSYVGESTFYIDSIDITATPVSN